MPMQMGASQALQIEHSFCLRNGVRNLCRELIVTDAKDVSNLIAGRGILPPIA